MMDGNQRKKDPVLVPSLLPDVQVILSRPSYPLGGSVVGTILIQQNGTSHHTSGLRSVLESVTVYVAGFCKIDSRWHAIGDYTKLYGRIHPYLQLLQERFDADLLSQSEDTVCFWATNGMEALDLTERIEGGRWNNNDFQRSSHEFFDDSSDDDDDDDDGNRSYNNNEEDVDDKNNNSKDDILAFTFRVEIPPDLPHSVHATTCTYYYTANVLVKTAKQQKILKHNFQVLSRNNNNSYHNNGNNQQRQNMSSARVKFGNCFGIAHSNGLPSHLSATEIHRPKGQMMVVQNHCLRNRIRQRNNDVQTLRVSNASGRPVCVLTIIGSQSLSPGSRIHLQWDFPTEIHNYQQQQSQQQQIEINNKNCWIPCHQVCACLQGEEYAIYEDGSKKRTKSFLFDTCHEYVDPDNTDRVSKTLLLISSGDNNNSNSAPPPCDLNTDVMEVSTWCQVDITVQENNDNNNNNNNNNRNKNNNKGKRVGGSYSNLSLKIPCRVRHSSTNIDYEEEKEMMTEDNYVQPLNELLFNEEGKENNDIQAFPTKFILSDLKTLSLIMEEIVNNQGEKS